MSWLEKIRQKTHAEKIRLIWIICTACVILLALVWLVTSRIGKNMPKDTSLFKTITKSLKSLK
jgi:predicted permease